MKEMSARESKNKTNQGGVHGISRVRMVLEAGNQGQVQAQSSGHIGCVAMHEEQDI